MLITTFVVVVTLLHASPVLAWGAAGHEIIATIAQIHLHPSVYPALCDILNFTSTDPNTPPCHLAPIAAWADKVRFAKRWSAPLHYVGAFGDHPSDTCVFPGERGWQGRKGGNVLGALRNVTGILEDWVGGQAVEEGDQLENEALKFLVHLLGDMHMPLHLTGRDRGGNSVKVRYDGRITNLHSVWDSRLLAKGIRTVPRNYSHPLPYPKVEHALRGTIYDSYIRRIIHEGVLGKWRDEVHSWLVCPDPPPTPRASGLRQQAMSSLDRTRGVEEETDDGAICPYAWAKPIHALNCELVWPKALDEPPYRQDGLSSSIPMDTDTDTDEEHPVYLELDTPEYAGVISDRWIVEKLFAMAGVRLAAVLNYLFADDAKVLSVSLEL